MTRHVDAYPLDSNNQVRRTTHWRWNDPQLPVRSILTNRSYWQGDTFFTEPHEDGECENFLPPIEGLM